MSIFLDLLTEKINDLYRAYEDHVFDSYLKKEDKCKLAITFMENNMIHFALFEKNETQDYELVDDIYINFEKERKLYEAIALRLFIKVLGNVMIHKIDDNIYYNGVHKPFVFITVRDDTLRKLCDQIISNQESEILTNDNKIVKEKSEAIKGKTYNRKFLNEIATRAELTKELLRRC